MGSYQDHEAESAAAILSWAIAAFGRKFAIATSFQKEGMAIVDLAARIDPRVRVFTLDTGRLPDETYRMIETVQARYGIAVEVVRPSEAEVAAMVAERGPDLFYESVENRRLCCQVRKVRPLERKLTELDAWATGLRREQSDDRKITPKVEQNGRLIKVNPLADWTQEQVDQYIADHGVPVHPLYARGYTSIGCAPCTRALAPGENGRDGRWWWEHDEKKECGIHISADGVVRRA